MNCLCPECANAVPVPDDATVGELIVCDHCGAELELAQTDPIELVLFEEEEK